MEELGKLTELQRADAAARAIQQLPKGRLAQYAPLVRGLPLLLHQHGLGQTLAYLKSRGTERADSPYAMLYGHLSSWLAEAFAEQGGDFLAALTRMESRRYLQAAEEAHAFALALREAAEAGEESSRPCAAPQPTEEAGR